jgi:hypothetical protein
MGALTGAVRSVTGAADGETSRNPRLTVSCWNSTSTNQLQEARLAREKPAAAVAAGVTSA